MYAFHLLTVSISYNFFYSFLLNLFYQIERKISLIFQNSPILLDDVFLGNFLVERIVLIFYEEVKTRFIIRVFFLSLFSLINQPE